MSKQNKSGLSVEVVTALFLSLIILFCLSCLAGSGYYFQSQQDLYAKQLQLYNQLQNNISWNSKTNIQQNFSLTEIEKRVEKIHKEVF